MANKHPFAWGWLAAWVLWTVFFALYVAEGDQLGLACMYIAASGAMYRFGTDGARRWG